MPYLKYEKTLYEISKDKAVRFAGYIDQRVKIPFGFERLDSFKCEILRELPWNWQEYRLVEDENVKKLEGPEFEDKWEEVPGKNLVRKVKALKPKK